MRLAVLIPVLLFAGLGWALYIGLNRENAQELPSVFLEKPAPALPAIALDGYAAPSDASLKDPGLKLVNFWASWCAPCRVEHATLVDLSNKGWTIIGINKSDEPDNARAFINELGNPYTSIAVDPNGRESIEWGVYGIPETFLIDDLGRIRLRHPGPVTSRVWSQRFEPVIEAIRAEGTGGS